MDEDYKVLSRTDGMNVHYAQDVVVILIKNRDVVLPSGLPIGSIKLMPGYVYVAQKNFDGGWDTIYDENEEA